MAFKSSKPTEVYWRQAKKLTWTLLSAWFAVTFCIVFFARELSEPRFFGWTFPYFSYYMAAQGAIFIYVIIVAIYAWRMSRLEDVMDTMEAMDAGEANEK